jgi:Protein of unknown function (DUF3168)
MSGSAGWQLQQAVYAALASNAALTTFLGGARIYDEVPHAAAYPFVTMGQTSSTDWGTGTEDGEEHIMTLHVWSSYGGRSEAQTIMGALRDTLHTARLTLTGHSLINFRQQFSDIRRETDGMTIHGLIRYRATTQPAGATAPPTAPSP